MANETQVRQDGIGGLVEDNPLAAAGVTLTSAGLAALVAIDATQFAWLVLDPDGDTGAPEHVKVTAHAAGATSATILRAQNGTVARDHVASTRWVLGPLAVDFPFQRGTGSPEGVVTATVGTLYLRSDGAASTTLYVKESGVGNTGWVAK